MSSPIQNRIGTVFVPVKDLERSAEFYSKVFGLPMKKVSPPVYNLDMEGPTKLTLDVDSFTSPVREGKVEPSPYGLCYVPTANIEEAHAYLRELDVEVTPITRFGNVAFFYFFDPDRNKIMVYDNGTFTT
jgi:catechol 2,3-dioxygenase-like lactoylglutathione lyase family enzyme